MTDTPVMWDDNHLDELENDLEDLARHRAAVAGAALDAIKTARVATKALEEDLAAARADAERLADRVRSHYDGHCPDYTAAECGTCGLDVEALDAHDALIEAG